MEVFFILNFKHFVITSVYYINLFIFSWNNRTHVTMNNHNQNQYTNEENIGSQLYNRYIQNNTYSTCYLFIHITMTMQHNPLIGNCNHTKFIFLFGVKLKLTLYQHHLF